MSSIIDNLIMELEVERQRHATFFSSLSDDDIFINKLNKADHFNYAPRSIYFYYISLSDDLRLAVSHYDEVHFDDPTFPGHPIKQWKEIADGDLEGIVKDLAIAARPGGGGTPNGKRFEGISWRRRSYIIIFCDEENLTFRKHANGNPVVFITKKNLRSYTRNHAFYDARELSITFSPTDTRSAIAFINHMKADPVGNDLGAGPGQDYQFNLFFTVKFEDGTVSPLDIIIDPGGTNQGPPLEP